MTRTRENFLWAALGALIGGALVFMILKIFAPHRPATAAQADEGAEDLAQPPITNALAEAARVARLQNNSGAVEEIERLRGEIAKQEKQISDLTKKSGGFLNPSREELVARAQRCEVQIDVPPLVGNKPPMLDKRAAESLKLSDTELDQVNEVTREMHADVQARMRALVSADSDAGAAEGPVRQLIEQVQGRLGPAAAQVRQQVAQERAGLQAAPALASLPPLEQAMRLYYTMGDEYERRLGERLGADKARSLRTINDGWGSKSKWRGCP